MQQTNALTLCTNSTNNIFSILETKPSESTSFRFLLWKEFFFFTPIVFTSSSSSIWVSLNAMKCSLKGHLSKIVWTNNHFQIIVTANIVPGQYKIQSPTWSSPSWSSIIASCGSHATAWPFAMKTPPLSTRSHSTPRHLELYLPTTFEFFLSHHHHILHCHVDAH